jgi:hypothetical protein
MSRRMNPLRPIAAVTALALALAPTAVMASDDAPAEPLTPRDTPNSVAQSVQVRVNADGVQQGNTNFRWSATQITANGDPNTTITVQVPERGALLHNLQKLGRIPQDNGMGQYEVPLGEQGFGVARSVSLFPQDQALPVDLKVEFTLDGQPITAEDLRGKSGTVTAKYTVTNKTTADEKLTFTGVGDKKVTKTVEADVPYVVEATSLLPFTWANLNTGKGLAGADGRGYWLTKWIALPFRPLSPDGSASFGWAANVKDIQIPSVLVQASPLYIPPSEDGEEEPGAAAKSASKKAGVAPPNISGDVEQIKSGLALVLSGMEQLTSGGGEDPLDKLQNSLNQFFQEFGADIQNVSDLLDPSNPDGATAQIKSLIGLLDEVMASLDKAEAALPQLEQASDALTADQAQAIADISDDVKRLADWAAGLSSAKITAMCAAAGASGAITPEQCKQLFTVLQGAQFQQGAAILAEVGPKIPQIDSTLATLDKQLPGTINTLQSVVPQLQKVLQTLLDSLTNLSSSMATIAQGLQDKNVDLPSMDQVVSQVVGDILASPGGQDLSSGMAQVQSGIGGVKSEVSQWAAAMVVAIQSAVAGAKDAVESGKATAEEAADKANTLIASVHGIVVAAGTSPLPYGGDPADAPEGTKLAGAYEFRIDAADAEGPATLPRILIALVLLLVGGFIGTRMFKRPAAAGAAAGAGAAGGAAAGAGAVPEGWASFSDQQAARAAAAGAAAGGATAGAAAAGAGPDEATQETAAFEPVSGDETVSGDTEAAGAEGATTGAAVAESAGESGTADAAEGAAEATASDAGAGAADAATGTAEGSAAEATGAESVADEAAGGDVADGPPRPAG